MLLEILALIVFALLALLTGALAWALWPFGKGK